MPSTADRPRGTRPARQECESNASWPSGFANNGQVYDAKCDKTTCKLSLDKTHKIVDVSTSGLLCHGSTLRLMNSVIGQQQVSNITAEIAGIATSAALLVLLSWMGYPATRMPRTRLSGSRTTSKVSCPRPDWIRWRQIQGADQGAATSRPSARRAGSR
jgi:hypothetical protein